MTRKLHRWKQIKYGENLHVCIHCGTTFDTIWVFAGPGWRYDLRTYLTPDGVRYTGFAPECYGEKQPRTRTRSVGTNRSEEKNSDPETT